jgi:hypothetical protein
MNPEFKMICAGPRRLWRQNRTGQNRNAGRHDSKKLLQMLLNHLRALHWSEEQIAIYALKSASGLKRDELARLISWIEGDPRRARPK